jgi:hypothetical protein
LEAGAPIQMRRDQLRRKVLLPFLIRVRTFGQGAAESGKSSRFGLPKQQPCCQSMFAIGFSASYVSDDCGQLVPAGRAADEQDRAADDHIVYKRNFAGRVRIPQRIPLDVCVGRY